MKEKNQNPWTFKTRLSRGMTQPQKYKQVEQTTNKS